VLEWPILLIAVIAPFAGGIVAFVGRQPRWLAAGICVAVLMFALMSIVSTGAARRPPSPEGPPPPPPAAPAGSPAAWR